MDWILQPHQGHVAAYLGDIVVYNQTWADHLDHVAKVLWSLWEVGLTTDPAKCHMGEDGKHITNVCPSNGQIWSQGPGLAEVSTTKLQIPGTPVSRIGPVLLMVYISILFTCQPQKCAIEGGSQAQSGRTLCWLSLALDQMSSEKETLGIPRSIQVPG